MNLLAVVVLLDQVRVYSESESDLFEVLSKMVQELPEGEVQKALREALHHRRSGLAAEACLAILRGINSYLDEFILTLGCINWQTGPALTLIADRLHQRAARRWDRASRLMLLKDRVWPIYLSRKQLPLVQYIYSLYSGNCLAFHCLAEPDDGCAACAGSICRRSMALFPPHKEMAQASFGSSSIVVHLIPRYTHHPNPGVDPDPHHNRHL